MIFKFTDRWVQSISSEELSKLLRNMMNNSHYIQCSGLGLDCLRKCAELEFGRSEKELFKFFIGKISPSKEYQDFLTIVDCENYPVDALVLISGNPSKVMVEDSANEWPVYEAVIESYKNDPEYKYLFRYLLKAKKCRFLLPFHAGGKTSFVRLMRDVDTREYAHVAKYKIGIITDRDSDDENSFSVQSNHMFREFWGGKDSSQMTNSDVYDLKPSDSGHWIHVWYKREIENYFPDSQYEALGIALPPDLPSGTARDYVKLSIDKGRVPELVLNMGRKDFERQLKVFHIQGRYLSEFQLLLLKLVKLV